MNFKQLKNILLLAGLQTVSAQQNSTTATTDGNAPIYLSEDLMRSWNELKRNLDTYIPQGFQDCSGEIDQAFLAASNVYKSGLSTQFFDAATYILGVAGDIDEVAPFREDFTNLTNTLKTYYQKQLDDRKAAAVAASSSAAAAAASATASASAAAARSSELAASRTSALAAEYSKTANVFVQATDEPHAYGVVSSAIQSFAVSSGVLGFIVTLML